MSKSIPSPSTPNISVLILSEPSKENSTDSGSLGLILSIFVGESHDIVKTIQRNRKKASVLIKDYLKPQVISFNPH
jgi:hypothetical protein